MEQQHQEDLFADGVGEITLVGGMVRMDLVSLSATQKDSEGKPALELRRRVVMPPDGFLRSFSAMENLVKQLLEAGAIQKSEMNAASEEPLTGRPDQEPPPKSPNFG